jgi:hypothetical protein
LLLQEGDACREAAGIVDIDWLLFARRAFVPNAGVAIVIEVAAEGDVL